MTLFEVLLTVHILAAIVWIGGGFASVLIGKGLIKSDNAGAMAAYCAVLSKLGGPLFGGSGFIVLASGIWMVIDAEGLEFSAPWISVGFAAWIASFILGGIIGGKAYSRAGEMLADGASLADTGPTLRRAELAIWGDIAVRVIAVVVMVWQPS